MEVMSKDLKLKTDYYLTYDYWPKGGTKVRVSERVPAKTVWSGHRGEAVKVKDADGNEYFIHPKAWLFDEMPNASLTGGLAVSPVPVEAQVSGNNDEASNGV